MQNVVTYDVVISVDNSELALKPGMTAAARIVVDQRSDVLRVPNQALHYTPKSAAETGQPSVAPGAASIGETNQVRIWILRDGEPKAVPVTVGLDDDSYTEITSGDVQAGDQVIVAEQGAASGHAAVPGRDCIIPARIQKGANARRKNQNRESHAHLPCGRHGCACSAWCRFHCRSLASSSPLWVRPGPVNQR